MICQKNRIEYPDYFWEPASWIPVGLRLKRCVPELSSYTAVGMPLWISTPWKTAQGPLQKGLEPVEGWFPKA